MKLNIDGETVSLNPDPTGGWCAVTEIDGERYVIHLNATRIGARPAVTPSHAPNAPGTPLATARGTTTAPASSAPAG